MNGSVRARSTAVRGGGVQNHVGAFPPASLPLRRQDQRNDVAQVVEQLQVVHDGSGLMAWHRAGADGVHRHVDAKHVLAALAAFSPLRGRLCHIRSAPPLDQLAFLDQRGYMAPKPLGFA
jgi:hypothetical protein